MMPDNYKWFYYRVCCSLLLLLALPLVAQADSDVADWQLVTQRDGIKVFMAQKTGAGLKTFRGITTIKLDDFTAFGPIMDNYDFVASWLHMISSIDGIKRVAYNNRLVRVTTSLPWPVSDRDVILRVGLFQNPVTYSVRMPIHSVMSVMSIRNSRIMCACHPSTDISYFIH